MRMRPLELALEVVEGEPELPGVMPENIRAAALQDPEEYSRDVVRATKEAIATRLRAAFASQDEELREMIAQGPAVVMVGRQEFLRLMSAAGEDPRALGNPPEYTDERVVLVAQKILEARRRGGLHRLAKKENTPRNLGASPALVLARELLHIIEGHKT